MAQFLTRQDSGGPAATPRPGAAAGKPAATTPGTMKEQAEFLSDAVREYARGPADAHSAAAYREIFNKQLAALQEYFPILETEAWRLVATTADIRKTLERITAFDTAADHLEEAADVLFGHDPAERAKAMTGLSRIQLHADALINALEETRARSGMNADGDSLLARAERYAASPRDPGEGDRLRADFHAQLRSIQDCMEALAERAAGQASVATEAEPSALRLALAQVRVCEIAAENLDDAREMLFEPDSKESQRFQAELSKIEDGTDALIHDLGRLVFDAELRSLQDRLDGLASTVQRASRDPGSPVFWRKPLMQARICRNEANRLLRDAADVYGQDAEKLEECDGALHAMKRRADDLIEDMSNRISGEDGDVRSLAEAISEWRLTRTHGQIVAEADSLLAEAIRHAASAGAPRERTRLREQFRGLLDAIKEFLPSLERKMRGPSSAAIAPSEWRLMRAQVRAYEAAAGKLEEALEQAGTLLFDAAERARIQDELTRMEDLADVLFNDIRPGEFHAELRSLQQIMEELRLQIPRRNDLPLPQGFWKLQLGQIRSCKSRLEKLRRDAGDVFDADSETATVVKAALNEIAKQADELTASVKTRAKTTDRRQPEAAIPEEPGEDSGSPEPVSRMSTFGSDAGPP